MSSEQHRSGLLPFHGVRFRADLPGGLVAVIGPPFDIESSIEAQAFVRGRPFNAVRLEIEDAQSREALRFSNARELYETWREQGVLRSDVQPSFYVYEQSFDYDGNRRTRRGIFGLVPIGAPDVCILPHEETWEENRQRRLQILRDLDASISPIFLIYGGRGMRATGHGEAAVTSAHDILDVVVARPPDAKGEDQFGNSHRLWVVSDSEEVRHIGEIMRSQQFIIADGHHRYEAARMYHTEREAPETGLILACCVAADDPGIVIQAIHRIISRRSAIDWNDAKRNIVKWFEIETEPVAGRSGRDLLRSLSGADLPEVGIITGDGRTFNRLQLRSWDTVASLVPTNVPDPVRRLDVSVITELVIRRALQIDDEAETDVIIYDNDADHVLAAVSQPGADIGILMRPIRLDQVMAVARAHGKVPAKSTSFVPKVPIGLVLHEF